MLGETGVVGGVFAFGGMLLALGGLLWPRCTAGWRRARETWLRRHSWMSLPPALAGANPRFCNPRWGNDSAAYGWEMAILVGIAYWLVHASVDWQWQMAGVSIPMLLLLAAGVASVDARADVMWPRWNRWLRLRGRAVDVAPVGSGLVHEATSSAEEEADRQDAGQEETAEDGQGGAFLPVRRTEKYLSEQRRRRRKQARKRGNAQRLQPPGVLSPMFRVLLMTLSLIVIVSTGLPYLSLQIQNSALGIAKTDGVRAASRAEAARWLQPADPGPFVTQARIYSSAASAGAASGASDRAGAVLDNLALSIRSYENAIAAEPADWTLRYRAGVATLNLLLASEYAAHEDPALDYATLTPLVPALEDWSALSETGGLLPEPGAAAGSLAKTATTRQVAEYFRGLSPEKLRQRAIEFLDAAKERNPLASQVTEALKIVQ